MCAQQASWSCLSCVTAFSIPAVTCCSSCPRVQRRDSPAFPRPGWQVSAWPGLCASSERENTLSRGGKSGRWPGVSTSKWPSGSHKEAAQPQLFPGCLSRSLRDRATVPPTASALPTLALHSTQVVLSNCFCQEVDKPGQFDHRISEGHGSLARVMEI